MTEFEFRFVNECKRLNLKRSDVAQALGITVQTLKRKLENPDRMTLGDLKVFDELGFNLNQIAL